MQFFSRPREGGGGRRRRAPAPLKEMLCIAPPSDESVCSAHYAYSKRGGIQRGGSFFKSWPVSSQSAMMDALEVAKAIGNGADPSGSFSDPLARAAEIAERFLHYVYFSSSTQIAVPLKDPLEVSKT